MNDSTGPVVVAVDEQSEIEIDVPRWSGLAEAALRAQRVPHGELNLLFVDAADMRALNTEHMGQDGPTDVLSFPLDGFDSLDPASMIGDIVICPTVAAHNAADHAGVDRHSGSVDDELALLVVHGVLHVLGHDHVEPAETERMEALEQELLTAHHR